jgi:hypothetical protein
MGWYKIVEKNKEILVLDFSDCREETMLEIVEDAKNILLAGEKASLLLSIYNDKSFATPKFMNAVTQANLKAIHCIDKQAVVGLNKAKKMILKGFNFFFKRNMRAFDTKESAIQFLIDDSTTDRDIPDYLR